MFRPINKKWEKEFVSKPIQYRIGHLFDGLESMGIKLPEGIELNNLVLYRIIKDLMYDRFLETIPEKYK